MNKIIAIFFALIFLFSCSQNSKKDSRSLKAGELDFSVVDSLNKYSNYDSILIPFKVAKTYRIIQDINDSNVAKTTIEHDTIDAWFCKNVANKIDFAYTQIGGKLAVYQKNQKKWLLTDSIDFFAPIKLNKMDLNGDGFLDLRFSNLYDEQNGDVLTSVFLFDKEQQAFNHNNSFGQMNVEYDKENKFIRFSSGIKKGSGGVKWRGVIVEDELIVDSTITFIDYSYKDSIHKSASISIFKGSNGASYTPIEIINGNADSLWEVFSKRFWNSNTKR